MKALLRTSLLVLFAVAVSSCYTPERYARNAAATKAWLDSSAGVSRLDLNGSWHADGWGHGHLSQKGSKVTGHIGRFPVHGVINGTTVYLAAMDEDWTSYSIVLTYARPGVLEGFYSDNVPYSDKDHEAMTLVRSHR